MGSPCGGEEPIISLNGASWRLRVLNLLHRLCDLRRVTWPLCFLITEMETVMLPGSRSCCED